MVHISRVEFWATKAIYASVDRAPTSDPLEHREKSLVTVVQVAADDLDGDGFASCDTLTDPDLTLGAGSEAALTGRRTNTCARVDTGRRRR